MPRPNRPDPPAINPEDMNTCLDCDHCYSSKYGGYSCHLNPPKTELTDQGPVSWFPPVRPDYYCGSFSIR